MAQVTQPIALKAVDVNDKNENPQEYIRRKNKHMCFLDLQLFAGYKCLS